MQDEKKNPTMGDGGASNNLHPEHTSPNPKDQGLHEPSPWQSADIFAASSEFYVLSSMMGNFQATFDYCKAKGIEQGGHRGDAVGVMSVIKAELLGQQRFEFASDGVPFFAFELLADDGETIIDICGWPLDRPEQLYTLLGVGSLVGENALINPATYWNNAPLIIHRTALEMFQHGFSGAAIIQPRRAAIQLLSVPRFAAKDNKHGRSLQSLIRTATPKPEILVQQIKSSGRAA